jgi:hypothetical protein
MSTRIVNFMKGNTIAMIALFIALGGTASAATLAANSVGTKQLKKSAVTAAKIKTNAVTTPKIKDGAVTGAKLAAGAVTGDKVNVATLGKVPSAANADNANTLGGVSKSVWGSSITYPGIAFKPRDGSVTWTCAGFNGAGIQCTAGSTNTYLFVMPLTLPQGCTITKMTMYHYNSIAATAGSLYLTKFDLPTGALTDVMHVASGSATGYGSVSMTPGTVVDNTTTSYVVYWWPAGNVNDFGGVKVEYTLPGALGGPAVHATTQGDPGPSTSPE